MDGKRCRVTTAAGVVFSVSIAFLLAAVSADLSRTSAWRPVLFAGAAICSVGVAALYASATAGAMLDRAAVLCGGALGVLALGPAALALPAAPGAVPYGLLIPISVSALAAVAVQSLPGHAGVDLVARSRAIYAMHVLQGGFIFGLALPAAVAMTWPRPFAVALVLSALLLWRGWGGCPLTVAENRLRRLEGRPAIPVQEGFISHRLGRYGIPVSGRTVGRALQRLGLALCLWWTLEWAFSLHPLG